MAEAVILSIAGKIASSLIPRALENAGKLCGVEHELEVLRDTVSTLQAIMRHAEEQYRNPEIQDWLEKLKDAFYDAQDVLEEFNINAIRRELRGHTEMIKEVRTIFSSSNQLAFKLKMSCKVRAVRERIETIKADKVFYLVERLVDLPMEREWRKREETHSFILEGDIKGRDDDKKIVMEILLNLNVKENVSVIPIVGIGGLGKTALAQFVYNDEMVNKHFHLKMWVCISNDFDMKKIVKNIIACAKKKKEPTESVMEQLQSELRKEIDGKRYLLVLDDLWDEDPEKWLSLKILLMGGARGSKILITTRLPSVARITSTGPLHLLGGLYERTSVDLLMQIACHKEEKIQDPEMLAIAKEIVRKCSGVPLVIRIVGHLLSSKKTTREWLCFKDDELPEVSQSEDRIKSVLRLSYDHLPSHLKQCFAFCSLFPKDYDIKMQTLFDLWMAEGFIQPSHRNQHLEDIAHGYFMDLLWSNFFQDFKKDPYTNEDTCKMHDLMHDLACLVAGTDYWVAWDDTRSALERTRHISHDLTSNFMGKLPISRLKASELRTFLSNTIYQGMEQREPMSEAYLHQLIQSFKRLRILDLHATNVKEVPRSICKLKYLTYLDLSHNITLKRLPNSITGLQNLQTLNLNDCYALEELPRGIKKLIRLRNLYLANCWKLSYLPRGLGQLSSLHRLTRFILPKDEALTKNCCRLGELSGLNNIRGNLYIENLGNVRDVVAESRAAANLIGMHSLESLKLEWGDFNTDDAVIGDRDEALLGGLRPHSNLQKLTVVRYKGESFPRWMMDSLVSSLPNLVELELEYCGRCKHLPPLGQLPQLKNLRINHLTELEYIESDHSSTLTTSFPSLMRLEICYSGNLRAMPLTPHLKWLLLTKVNPALLNQTLGPNKLKQLHIWNIEFLECMPEEFWKGLTSLEFLTINHCPRLTSLLLGMRRLSNLMVLSISECKELDLFEDESSNILDFHGLQSLSSVQFNGLPKLASFPQWFLQVNNLKCLIIHRCSNLKALPEHIEAFQSLQWLDITGCHMLTSLPEGMRRLSFLTGLNIYNCPKLEERCKKDVGEDWYKIAHIPDITHELKYY